MNHSTQSLNKPDFFIFDLDPSESIEFEVLKELGFELKNFLSNLNYTPFIKTSGSKGLHIYVPIHNYYSSLQVFESVKKMAIDFIDKHNNLCTLNMAKAKRKGKVLLDIYRNHRHQTCIAPFSIRGKINAPISMPFHWESLNNVNDAQHFKLHNVFDYLSKNGNAWDDFFINRSELHDHKKKSISNILNTVPQTLQAISKSGLKHMLAESATTVPSNKKYSFEIKWDGIRTFIIKENNAVTVLSRNGNDITNQFPEFQEIILLFPNDDFVIDAELVCLDQAGKPVFSDIVSRLHTKGKWKIKNLSKILKAYAFAFDLIWFNGQNITQQPQFSRRKILQSLLENQHEIKFSKDYEHGEHLYKEAKEMGLEGIMAKNKNAAYKLGEGPDSWLKIKFKQLEKCLIIGYTPGKGERLSYFGALHLGVRNKNKLEYRGKVGSGFDQNTLKSLAKLVKSLPTTSKLIENTVENEGSVWVEPKQCCLIEFASFTSNNTYREPIFKKIIT